ncbi:MAG: hypothetical protein HRT97_16635 [Moritella sp.]|nr:hypothetical protein [Moritella sp.]
MVNGYIVEGHVPVIDINKLLAQHKREQGIAIPEMQYVFNEINDK